MLCTWLGSAALAAPTEVRRIESVGAVEIDPNEPAASPLREAALERALEAAVQRIALELLPPDREDWGRPQAEDGQAGEDPGAVEDAQARPAPDPDENPSGSEEDLEGVVDPVLAKALGDDPFDYTPRFRILEDRGVRPALFSTDPEIEEEYVVLVEVHVDVDRVAERLERAGLLVGPSGEAESIRLCVVVEGLSSFRAYERIRSTLVTEVGVPSAMPVELERGRAVLEVDAGREAEVLLDDLLREAPPELRIIPLEVDEEGLVLLVDLVSPVPTAAPDEVGETGQAGPGTQAIDTSNRNRY